MNTPSLPRFRLCLLAALLVSALSSCASSNDLPAEYWVTDIYHAGLTEHCIGSALTFTR